MSQTVSILEEVFNLFMKFCQDFFFASLMIFQAFALWDLKAIKLEVVGSVLNFRRAALCR